MVATEPSAANLHLHLRQNLPLLRRFGRALTGDQQQADVAMVQLMEDLLIQASALTVEANIRVTLYRQILCNLTMVSPTPRQALLLTAVEGFAHSEAADVLGISLSELDHLLQKAAAEMADQSGARVLIIEDQQFIAAKLEALVSQIGHDVVGISASRSEAVDCARRIRPDLILTDIQLADGSTGLAAMHDIQTEQDVPFIIITAHPELLLTGKHQEPAFVIHKPFVDNSVAAIISQALFLRSQG